MKREIPSQKTKKEFKPIAPKIKTESISEEEITVSESEPSSTSAVQPKKKCSFCTAKSEPSYADTSTLRRFMTDRARIIPREKSGICAKHQRRVTKEIKHARHLSLLPFTPTV